MSKIKLNVNGEAVELERIFPSAGELVPAGIAFNDDSNGALSQIHVYLPAGTYYADVAGFAGVGGGTYDLSVTADAVAIEARVPRRELAWLRVHPPVRRAVPPPCRGPVTPGPAAARWR